MKREDSRRIEALYPYGVETSTAVVAGVGSAIAYYSVVYLSVNEQIHDERDEASQLEADANSFIVTRDHMEDQGMLKFGQNYYLTETAYGKLAEAQVIRDESASQGIEQIKVVSVGLGAGALAFAICLVARNTLHKYRDHKQSKISEDFLFTTPEFRKEHKRVMKKVKNTIDQHTDDDDFTPPPAA